MATAIEYGLIAGGVSLAIIAAVSNPFSTRVDWELDIKAARQACAARPPGDIKNVVIKSWIGYPDEYSCPSWPRFSNPTYVRSFR